MKDNENIINRQRAKIAVLSLENANLKICVEDLNAELENKNVEIDILIRKKKSLRDEISELTAEVERLKTRNDELNALNKTASIEAIREFAEMLKPTFDKAINGIPKKSKVFAFRGEIIHDAHLLIDHVKKEMVGDGDA